MHTAHSRRTYDHRIREAILESGERDLFPELRIPPSTIRSCFHRGLPEVTTAELASCDRAALLSEIRALRQRAALLAGVVGLLTVMLRLSNHPPERLSPPAQPGAPASITAAAIETRVAIRHSIPLAQPSPQGLALQVVQLTDTTFRQTHHPVQLIPAEGRPLRRPLHLDKLAGPGHGHVQIHVRGAVFGVIQIGNEAAIDSSHAYRRQKQSLESRLL